jgi:hypothetical protein
MNKYQIISHKLQATLLFGFNSNGVLNSFEIKDVELTLEKTQEVLASVHYIEAAFLKYCSDKKIPVVKVVTDLSFEAFWKAYDYKQGKVKAAQEWNKLNDNLKAAAIDGIRKYKKNIPQGVALVYAERYLKNRRWED